MKRVDYMPPNDWSGARLVYEDEFGNRGEVRWPRSRERGFGRINIADEWEDAEVHMNTRCEGSADETAAAAEFAFELAHVAKTLDLAYAEERERAIGEAERVEAEREQREKVKDLAVQMRCEEIGQYYLQMVRVQREGHSSNASGELHVVVLREGEDDQAIKRQMWLRERNGNRWTFNADEVAKFEVKDGARYNEIKLKAMEVLRGEASLALQEGATA
jgi:hypothetical protein